MTWAKFDDQYPHHLKMLRAGLDALGFDVAGVCYCNRYLTDGFIADDTLDVVYPRAKNPERLARRLVEIGRWERDDDAKGYRIHDYLEYNPSRADVEAERAAARERMRRLRGGKGRSASSSPNVQENESPNVHENDGETSQPPTRPDPTLELDRSTPPTSTNGANTGVGGGHAEGVDETLATVAVVLSSFNPPPDPRDIETAIALMRPRVAAGEISSPVAFGRGVLERLADERVKAEKAKEPKVVEIEGEPHEWDPETRQWKRVEEVATP